MLSDTSRGKPRRPCAARWPLALRRSDPQVCHPLASRTPRRHGESDCPASCGRRSAAPRPRGGRRLLGGTTPREIVTVCVGGSRQVMEAALQLDASVTLVQEHRLVGPAERARCSPRGLSVTILNEEAVLAPPAIASASYHRKEGHANLQSTIMSMALRHRRTQGGMTMFLKVLCKPFLPHSRRPSTSS